MWLCNYPHELITPEIVINCHLEHGIGGLRIWNYNKGIKDTINGVKELEVYINGEPKWFGLVNRGTGNIWEEYYTQIKIKKRVVLPRLE